MSMRNPKIESGTRLASMILDHMIMTFIVVFGCLPIMLWHFKDFFGMSHTQPHSKELIGGMIYMVIPFSLYLCKDCIRGRSIAKRIMTLQVVNNSSGVVASPLQCFIRNIFCVIWPLEVLIILFSPERRIGDFVAGTKVVKYDMGQANSLQIPQIILSLLLSMGFLWLFTIPFMKMAARMPEEGFIESSYNAGASQEITNLCNDSLKEYMVADIHIYDKVLGPDSNKKYISAILTLRDNYIEDEDVFRQLKRKVGKVLYPAYPTLKYTGSVRYVYRDGGSMTASSESYDSPLVKEEESGEQDLK